MVTIPAGAFRMGSPEGEGHDDERPRHEVHLDAFRLERYPVTVDRFREFCAQSARKMPLQPRWSGGDHPVVNVCWEDAAAYCAWAGKRLPTEAQWEKAARGGTETRYFFGEREELLGEFAWYRCNSGLQTNPVGLKRPNPYMLFDILGNVWEWTADFYDADYYRKSPAADPKGPDSGSARVIRGGSWRLEETLCRSAARNFLPPDMRAANLGFRCAE